MRLHILIGLKGLTEIAILNVGKLYINQLMKVGRGVTSTGID